MTPVFSEFEMDWNEELGVLLNSIEAARQATGKRLGNVDCTTRNFSDNIGDFIYYFDDLKSQLRLGDRELFSLAWVLRTTRNRKPYSLIQRAP